MAAKLIQEQSPGWTVATVPGGIGIALTVSAAVGVQGVILTVPSSSH